ncbi:MAG: GntR family transcriptional regulator [Acidimicrobiia bacterium]|nr:GntR family transcriptional regulator [Acidimicrobiia bacterium]
MTQRTDPVARNVLSDQVKDRILQWILEGELEPGSRIVETRVARELGVSQAPVREALRDLATLGVVEMQPYKGARVRQPNKPELVEQMELRGELEALAARYAAKRMTPELLDELQGLIADMHELAEAGDAHGHAINNTQFHKLIVNAAGNATLERVWSMLDPYAHTYVTASAPGIDLVWLGDRHVAIVEALEAGDPERAADAMRLHAKEAEEVVLAMDDDHFGRAPVKRSESP